MKEMNEMKKLSENILNDLYEECFKEFEKCQDELVEKMFETEFKW